MSNNQQRPDELSFGSNAAVEIEAPILETVTDQRRAQLRAPVNNVNSSQEGLDVAQRTGRTQSRIRQFISSTTDDWFGDDDGVVVNRQNTVAMANIGGAPKYPVMSNQPRTAVNTAPVEPNQPIKQPAPKPTAEANLKSSSSANSPATVNNNSILASAKIIKNSPVKDPTPIQTSKPQIHQQKFIENPSSSSSSKSPVTNKKDEDWILVGSESQASMATEDGVTAELNQINNTIARIEKFRAVLDQANVDLEKLRKLSWNGVPGELRPTVWKMLLASGYMPANHERQKQVLTKKRSDYADYVRQSFGQENMAGVDQIVIDIPRTNPGIKLFQQERVQKALERILYCWAIRHPASGYVQGINDLVTPFFHVFLTEFIREDDIEHCRLGRLSDESFAIVEADAFWCLSKLLDGIQDNYTHTQPGIQRMLVRMKELVGRIDAKLYSHLESQNIEFLQFAFRWMNCLLMREMSLRNVIRMCDTYLSEGPDGFSDFHIYVSAAFLVKWSAHLQKQDFSGIIMFLQSPPTKEWASKEIELLLSEAFMWKSLFHNAPKHLSGTVRHATNWSI